MTDNIGKWKIVDAIYKLAVVALLSVAVVLLWDMRNRQQSSAQQTIREPLVIKFDIL
jgi:hypothetical protein